MIHQQDAVVAADSDTGFLEELLGTPGGETILGCMQCGACSGGCPLGASMQYPPRRMILVHLLPNAMGPVLVTATITVASAILTESALSFLGFGVQPPDATWGNILADGRAYIFDAPWLFFIPGGAIFTVVLAFNLVGEGLREASDPKLRRR